MIQLNKSGEDCLLDVIENKYSTSNTINNWLEGKDLFAVSIAKSINYSNKANADFAFSFLTK